MSERTEALAKSLEAGARALASFASELTEEEWHTRTPKDGRKVGVIVYHVAVVYPLEIEFARSVAAGKPVGVTLPNIHEMNAGHAKENDGVTKEETLDLLARYCSEAAAAIRALTDNELDRAAAVPFYSDAVVTCQFVLEDHAVRHSYHHLARLREALK
jgi:hypothetical protein